MAKGQFARDIKAPVGCMCENYLLHMSQWVTFLYSPRLGIQSSRPNAWPPGWLSSPGGLARPPRLDKARRPPHACGRIHLHNTHACAGKPTRLAL